MLDISDMPEPVAAFGFFMIILLVFAACRPSHPMRALAWRPHLTATQSFMRRRRWYGWQTRLMTSEECSAHFSQFWNAS